MTTQLVAALKDLHVVDSTQATIQSLPPELTHIILDICVNSGRRPLGQLFTTRDESHSSVDLRSQKNIGASQALLLSHVCSNWRSLLLSSPAFWALIPVSLFPSSAPQVSRLDAFLTRSQSLPLDFVICDSATPEDLTGSWFEIEAILTPSHAIVSLLYSVATRWRSVFTTWLLFWNTPFLQKHHFPLLEQLFLVPFRPSLVKGAPELSKDNITSLLAAPRLHSLSIPWVSFGKTLYLTTVHTNAVGPTEFFRVVLAKEDNGRLDHLTSLSVSGMFRWPILLQPVKLPALERWTTPYFMDRLLNKPRLWDLTISTLPGLASLADHLVLPQVSMTLRVLSLKINPHEDTIRPLTTILERLPTLESLEFASQLGLEWNGISDLIPLFSRLAVPSSLQPAEPIMPRLQSFRLSVEGCWGERVSMTAGQWDAFEQSFLAFVQPRVPRSLFRTLYVDFDVACVEMEKGVREHIRESMARFSERSCGQIHVYVSHEAHN